MSVIKIKDGIGKLSVKFPVLRKKRYRDERRPWTMHPWTMQFKQIFYPNVMASSV
jgi:hypothetical protein